MWSASDAETLGDRVSAPAGLSLALSRSAPSAGSRPSPPGTPCSFYPLVARLGRNDLQCACLLVPLTRSGAFIQRGFPTEDKLLSPEGLCPLTSACCNPNPQGDGPQAGPSGVCPGAQGGALLKGVSALEEKPQELPCSFPHEGARWKSVTQRGPCGRRFSFSDHSVLDFPLDCIFFCVTAFSHACLLVTPANLPSARRSRPSRSQKQPGKPGAASERPQPPARGKTAW